MEQGVAFVAPLGGHGGAAEWEGFDLSDDLVVAHGSPVTEQCGGILDLDRADRA
jgi:hypothetical protein